MRLWDQKMNCMRIIRIDAIPKGLLVEVELFFRGMIRNKI